MIYPCPHCRGTCQAEPGRNVACPHCGQPFMTPLVVARQGSPTMRAHKARQFGDGVEALAQVIFHTTKLVLLLGLLWLFLSCAGIL